MLGERLSCGCGDIARLRELAYANIEAGARNNSAISSRRRGRGVGPLVEFSTITIIAVVSPVDRAVRRVRFCVLPPDRGRLLLGSLPEIRRDPLAFLSRVGAEYGDIVRIRLGPLNAFVLNHPDDIEQVLVTHQHRFIKGRTLNRARRLFGDGFDKRWCAAQRQRRLVQPAFHRARLNEYAAIMTTAAAARATRGATGTSSISPAK